MRIMVYADTGGSGGYLRYCRGIFGRGRVPEGYDVFFVCSPQLARKLGPLDDKIGIITHPWPSSPSRIKRYFWHLWIYPHLARKIQPDIEFYPTGQIRILRPKAKSVATCHNLLLFDSGEIERFDDTAQKSALLRDQARQRRSYSRADGVIFLSGHSRDVVNSMVPDIKGSEVIPLGRNDAFSAPSGRNYGFDGTITLLYVSYLYPYKNPEIVIRAVARIRRRSGLEIILRLVGGGEANTLSRLRQAIEKERAEGWVVFVGELDDAGLVSEYSRADLFVFASSCECFPNILLEAMSAALPIACSNRAGLPEITAGAAVYFDPWEVDSLTVSLETLLEDEKLRRTLGKAALRRVRDYSWEEAAEHTFAYLRKIGS